MHVYCENQDSYQNLTFIFTVFIPHIFIDCNIRYKMSITKVCYILTNHNKMNCELMFTYDTPTLWQTGSRNLTGQKTLLTIWGTYMKLVTKYQISSINSCWEKCDEKFLGRTDRGKTVYPPPPSGSGGIIKLTASI